MDGSSDPAEAIRASCKDMQRKQIPDRPDLWETLTPDYNPGCKRVIITDDYYPAIANPKTTLETNKIKRITETGIELENGTHHDHDMIVLATGFRTVEFLFPIKITGTNDRTLADVWSGGASALYGTTVPSLPNFGMFYGPNTNLGHNSIILMIEAQSRYLNTLVSAVLDAQGRGSRIGIMPKQDRTDAYNEMIQEVLKNSSFADPKCGSWYKNKEGKITNNWSGTVIEYQKMWIEARARLSLGVESRKQRLAESERRHTWAIPRSCSVLSVLLWRAQRGFTARACQRGWALGVDM
jgi:hypothetical protein